jgi:hypothetical protein
MFECRQLLSIRINRRLACLAAFHESAGPQSAECVGFCFT